MHKKTKVKEGVAYYSVDGSSFKRSYAKVKGQFFKSEKGLNWQKSGRGPWKRGSFEILKELDRKMKEGECEVSPESDLWN